MTESLPMEDSTTPVWSFWRQNGITPDSWTNIPMGIHRRHRTDCLVIILVTYFTSLNQPFRANTLQQRKPLSIQKHENNRRSPKHHESWLSTPRQTHTGDKQGMDPRHPIAEQTRKIDARKMRNARSPTYQSSLSH